MRGLLNRRQVLNTMLGVGCALLTGEVALGAQATAAPRKLGRPLVELEEPFSGILDLRELSNGSVIALDGKDNVMWFVHADFGQATRISREGSGPTEYRRVLQLVGRGRDTTLAYDVLNARFLVIGSTGVPSGTISLREAAGGMPVGPAQVRGYDAQGRLYYQGIKVSMGKAGPSVSDTTYILRLDPASKRTDTLGTARIGMPGMKMSGDMQKGTGKVSLAMPAFPVIDEWALLPGGEVLVLRGANYQMQFFGGAAGPRTRPPVPFVPVKVTDADKVRIRKQMKEAETEMRKAVAGAAAAVGRSNTPIPGMAMEEPDEWPATKPPFNQGALKVASNGEIWVQRTRDARNESPLYDVFGPDGTFRYQVELPPKHVLAGIGRSHLYAAREDEDGLMYLGRYTRP
jgi:hypothetical protein